VSAKRISIVFGFALLACGASTFLELKRPLAYIRLDNLYRDAIARSGKTTPANPKLVFLAIDAASVSLDETDIDEIFTVAGGKSDEGRALRLMSKGFPWSREIYALVLDRLIQAGARTVIFDLNFPTPTDHDAAFHAALDRYADRVIIGSNFVDGSLVRPCETLVPQSIPTDSRTGFSNFWADEDDVVRRAQYRVTFEQVRNLKMKSGSEQFVSVAAGALTKAGFVQDVPNDLDPRVFRFTAPPRAGFPTHSLFEIFVPTFWQQNYQSGEFFRDKIVIVGADGNWQHDEHPTPFGNMPGAEIHLNAINAALHHEFIRELPLLANLVCIGLAALAAALTTLLVRAPWGRLILILVVGHAAVLISLFCFNRASIYLPIVAPFTVFVIATLFGLIFDFATERIDKMRVRRVLERYVSRDVVHELVDHPTLYRDSLGGVTKPVAILFSDIRSYSIVTARSSPQTLVAQLNEYFSAMVECVFENGGTLDKFIGDALMASWGSLDSRGARDDAVASVRAGLAMQERIRALNQSWSQRGWPELRVGMAINYGEVVVGNIGSPQRMEFTLIGDAVNVSWKLQELTKTKKTNLILSESVASLVADHFDLRSLGSATLDQSHQPCEIFTIGSAAKVDADLDHTRNEAWHAGAGFRQVVLTTPSARETAEIPGD
jgi:adenylate cyclase